MIDHARLFLIVHLLPRLIYDSCPETKQTPDLNLHSFRDALVRGKANRTLILRLGTLAPNLL